MIRVFIGWDASQMAAWNVAAASLRLHARKAVDIRRIALPEVRAFGLYTRPTMEEGAGYWDVLSEAPMSTGHAIARFLVPHLCDFKGWAVFMDGDVLLRADIAELVALGDSRYAVQVVQHVHVPTEATKMEGQIQTAYARKNWSSVVLWNCEHPAHKGLTLELVNTARGRDLHRFCWLSDDQIGELPAKWNLLIGSESHPDPALVHFTDGLPYMPGYESSPYAAEWHSIARSIGYNLEARV